jgi:hypothetical protein
LAISKAEVILTRRQFLEGLRRGKYWQRHEAMATRLKGQEPDA